MEYILAALITLASADGVPSNVNTSLRTDTLTQCNNIRTAFEAIPGAQVACSQTTSDANGPQQVFLYAADNDRAIGGIGLATFATASQCSVAKTAFEATDGSAVTARAACLVVPIGGRND